MLAVAPGCGFRFGPPPAPAVSVGTVESRAVEPGLRTGLESALIAELRRAGADEGPPLDLRVESMDQTPTAAAADVGTVAFTARIRVHAEVKTRPGCAFEVETSRAWLQEPAAPIAVSPDRSIAVDALAEDIAARILAELISRPECR